MKPIEETHPSLSSSCFFNTPGDSIREEDKRKIQKHTVDKAVLREAISKIPYWELQIEGAKLGIDKLLLKELGLEEEDERNSKEIGTRIKKD